MWLSGVVEDASEQQICLENVLVINPENDKHVLETDLLLRCVLHNPAEPHPGGLVAWIDLDYL